MPSPRSIVTAPRTDPAPCRLVARGSHMQGSSSSIEGGPCGRSAMAHLHSKTHSIFYFFFLRKEVIQPHLPIRLPCYDFTPVANPTFGSVLTRLDY